MPIIDFSEEDIKAATIVDPAYYVVDIRSIGEETSKNGQSTNYPVEALILRNDDNGDDTFAGVPLSKLNWMFNSKFKVAIMDFLKAFDNEVVGGSRFELADLAGQQVAAFVGNDTFEGRTKNKITHQYRKPRAA